MNGNAPSTLGGVIGLIPSGIAALIIAFLGQDWTTEQTAAVVGFAAILGSLFGILTGRYVQSNYTDPKPQFDSVAFGDPNDGGDKLERGAMTFRDALLIIVLVLVVICLIAIF